MFRRASIARALAAVAAVWHASAFARAASPRALLLPAVVDVHSNVLVHGGETAAPAAVAQEDKEKRVVGPADEHHQQAHVKGTARASGIADAAPATRSASAKGAQRWARTGFASSTNAEYPSPAVSPDGATVFVGSDDKKAYALNATTGAQRWAFATGGAVRSSPAVSPDGATVFVSSHDAQVYALNSNPPCSPASSGPNGGANEECLESAKVVAVTQRPPPEGCSFMDILMTQLPTLFLCGLAYLGVKFMCSVIPKPPETPVTMSSFFRA
jgi:hypothetical protein